MAAKFIAYKLREKNWGIERVSKHQDYSGKYCPHKTLDLGWERFLNLIREELNLLQVITTPTKDTEETFEPYTVTVTADVLNVRSGIGTSNPITTKIKKGEVYTIVEENNGWGKLKSGAGWISLAYTTRGKVEAKPVSSKYSLGLYIVTANVLNVRTGAGTNYSIKKTYKKNTRFDTYEIRGNWAKTPSGWTCLDYCKLVYRY